MSQQPPNNPPEPPDPSSTPPAHRKINPPQLISSFRHRNYRLWFAGQLVSLVGTWMQIIAQGWLVYQISHSEFDLGLVGFAAAIPSLIISPWGGVATDRISRRTLLVLTQTALMVMAFILALLSFANVVQVWHIIVLAALQGVVNAFDAPARLTFVFDMVGREDINNAIALNSTMFNGARVIGPALGGVLLGFFGARWCFLINGFSFLAVIAGLLMMTFPARELHPSKQNPFRQMLDGLLFVRGRRDILALLVLSLAFGVFGMAYSSQLPAFVDKVLHSDETSFGALNAAIGVGAFAAGVLLAQLASASPRGKMVTVSAFVYPLFMLAFAFNTSLNLALVLTFGLGFFWLLLFNNINSLLQLNTSEEMRGRVMSLYSLVFFGFSPFGSLLIGAVAERIPLNLTIALSGVITLALTVVIFFFAPELKKLS
jgi:MFS family permease